MLKALDPADYEKFYVEKYDCIINITKNYILGAKKIKSNIRQNELDLQDLDRLTKGKRLMEETNQRTMTFCMKKFQGWSVRFLMSSIKKILMKLVTKR